MGKTLNYANWQLSQKREKERINGNLFSELLGIVHSHCIRFEWKYLTALKLLSRVICSTENNIFFLRTIFSPNDLALSLSLTREKRGRRKKDQPTIFPTFQEMLTVCHQISYRYAKHVFLLSYFHSFLLSLSLRFFYSYLLCIFVKLNVLR